MIEYLFFEKQDDVLVVIAIAIMLRHWHLASIRLTSDPDVAPIVTISG